MPTKLLDRISLPAEERQILAELKEILHRLLGARLQRAVLFGSKARGDAEYGSDIDVAIVVDGLDRKQKWQVFDAVADLELKYLRTISLLSFSSEQFDELMQRERRLALDIEREGIPI